MITAHPANLRIVKIYHQHDLTRPVVGEMAGVGRSRVDSWMCPPDSPNYRECPERLVRLIEFELGIRKARYTPAKRMLRKIKPGKGRNRR